MKDRIQQVISSLDVPASKFAEMLDVQPSNISHILSGRNNPSAEFIIRLLTRMPQISPDWLLLNEGQMYRQNMQDLRENDLFSVNNATAIPAGEDPADVFPDSNKHLSLCSKTISHITVYFSDKTFENYKISE